jgi:hypothetical protein
MLRLLEAEDTTGVGVWYSWQVEIRKSIEQRDRDRGLDLATSKPQVFDVAWRPGFLPTQPSHSGQQIQRSSQADPSTEAGGVAKSQSVVVVFMQHRPGGADPGRCRIWAVPYQIWRYAWSGSASGLIKRAASVWRASTLPFD